MGSMSTSNGFGSFWVGNSGLTTSSNGIYVTGNNLANLHTTGYVRQRLLQADQSYNTMDTTKAIAKSKIGLGVTSAEILHTRDVFLDKYYRQENGRLSFYETLNETTDEIETIFQELEGEAFETSLDDFWQAFAELAKDPSDSVYQELVVQKASLFISKAQSLYQGLKEYQENVNQQVVGAVDEINDIAEQIAELNKKIAKYEAGGVETAYTLRDERDALLDELSQYAKIQYEELTDTTVRVKIDGVTLVDGTDVFGMEVYSNQVTGYYDVIWSALSDTTTGDANDLYYVYDTLAYNNEQNSDIGKLKALLISRGQEVSDYMDYYGTIDTTTQTLNVFGVSYDLSGASSSSYKDLAQYAYEVYGYNDRAGTFGVEDTTIFGTTDRSLIQEVEAKLDSLIHEIVTSINDILSPLTESTVAITLPDDFEGTLTVYDSTTGSYVSYSAGETIPAGAVQIWDSENGALGGDDTAPGQELFSRLYTDRYTEVTSGGVTYYIYNEENMADTTSMYSITSLQVNPILMDDASKLPSHNVEGDVATAMGEALDTLWEDDRTYLDNQDFVEFYSELIGDIGTYGTTFSSFKSTMDSTVTEIESERAQVITVSSDEELTNMIKFQNAYNAASRYINVIDEMVEIIVGLI